MRAMLRARLAFGLFQPLANFLFPLGGFRSDPLRRFLATIVIAITVVCIFSTAALAGLSSKAQSKEAGSVTVKDSRAMEERVFSEEIERNFPLRMIGRLQVTNLRGSVSIIGWAQDRIRVKAVRRARASSLQNAKALFSAVDFRYRSVDGDIELSAEYGNSLGIEQRLKERKTPLTSMDMIVYAPSTFVLRAWAAEGAVSIRSWGASIDARTSSGAISVNELKGDNVSILCPSCAITATQVRGSLRCMAGTGTVELRSVKGDQIYVESTSGSQDIEAVEGDQLYVSKQGLIRGRRMVGHVEFHTGSGAIEFKEVSGFVSGKSETGAIEVQMDQWKFVDKALIESNLGDVSLSLPSLFSGEVDLWSVTGRTELAFVGDPIQDGRNQGPEPVNHIRARIGTGGEQLRIFSKTGNIKILKNR